MIRQSQTAITNKNKNDNYLIGYIIVTNILTVFIIIVINKITKQKIKI